MAFAKEIMKLCINAPEGVSSPWFGPKIADLLHDMYGLDYDRFRQEKLDSNRFVLERLPAIREKVTGAKDPVFAGLQFAILGNYLDFSALQGRSALKSWRKCWTRRWKWSWMIRCTPTFAGICARGGKLVYLTDNAERIGFDGCWPSHRGGVSGYVRRLLRPGHHRQNDATREDAAAVGIPFPVIDNGATGCGHPAGYGSARKPPRRCRART